MKRTKKLLMLLAVLVLVLGAAYGATKLNPESEAAEDTSAVLFTLDPGTVTELGWDYGEEILFSHTENGWSLKQDPNFPVDASYLTAMLDALAEVTASKTIEGVEDYDQYGLEAPLCTVTVTTDATHVFSLGNETSMGGERYLSNGDGNVYLVDSAILTPFCYELYDVLAYEAIPSIRNVTGMEVASGIQSYAVTCKENTGLAYFGDKAWVMDGKVLDTELTEALITSFMDFQWIECVNYHAEDLSAYGLEEPAAVVTLHYLETVSVSTGEVDEDGNTVFEERQDPAAFTLEIGGEVNGRRYARLPGSRMVYTIDGGLVDTMVNTTYYELRPDDVLVMDWECVTAMDITLDGETYALAKETRSVTDEEGNTTEETVYTLNGADVSLDGIQNALDNLSSVGYATGTPGETEELRFRFYRNTDDFPEVEIAFYRYDSTSCMTVLNGEATVFTSREAIVDLVEEVNAIVLNRYRQGPPQVLGRPLLRNIQNLKKYLYIYQKYANILDDGAVS